MKYIIRALKYFCYLIVLLAVIILALVLTGFVEADLSKMFVNGYDSLWQIALIMLFFAAAVGSTQFLAAGWNNPVWQLFLKIWPILLSSKSSPLLTIFL